MSVLSPDTDPKMEAIQIQLIRRMPSWKKISILEGLNETVETLDEMMRDALRRRSSFNLIHYETAFKANIFIRMP